MHGFSTCCQEAGVPKKANRDINALGKMTGQPAQATAMVLPREKNCGV